MFVYIKTQSSQTKQYSVWGYTYRWQNYKESKKQDKIRVEVTSLERADDLMGVGHTGLLSGQVLFLYLGGTFTGSLFNNALISKHTLYTKVKIKKEIKGEEKALLLVITYTVLLFIYTSWLFFQIKTKI